MRSYALLVAEAMAQVDSGQEAITAQEVGSLPEPGLYESIQWSIEAARNGLAQVELPDDVSGIHEDLLTMLNKETERWTHMVLFARTGQELHRVLADQLGEESAALREVAISRLRQVVEAAGLDPDDLGLVVSNDGQATQTPTLPPDASSQPTPSPAAATEAAPTLIPLPTPTTMATALPTSAAIPTATVASPSTPEPVPALTPTPTPSPAPLRKFQDPPVIRWPDSYDRPAFIVHWTVPVEAGITAFVEYPFIGDDELELSVSFDQEFESEILKNTVFEAPAGDVLVSTGLVELLWESEVVAPVSGRYRFYFDNTGNKGYVTVHLLVTYHEPGPGTFVPPLGT